MVQKVGPRLREIFGCDIMQPTLSYLMCRYRKIGVHTGYLPEPKAEARMAVQFSVYLGFRPLSPTALMASVWMLLTCQ